MRGGHHVRLFVALFIFQGVLLEITQAGDPTQASSPAGSEWSSYGGDAAQERFSSLSEINQKSIPRLGLRWALDLPSETNLVATPLMVNGLLYFTGKFSVVYAVDARTGKVTWSFDPKAREELAKTPRRMTL